MIIGYAHIIKISTEEILKIKGKEEMIYSFKSDGEECLGGDLLRFEEKRENGLKGEIIDCEILRVVYDKKTDMFTARLRPISGEMTLL